MTIEKKKTTLGEVLMLSIAAAFVLMHFYTAYFGALPRDGQRPVHLGLVLLFFFVQEICKKETKIWNKVFDVILMVGSVGSLVYLIIIWDELQDRLGVITTLDKIFCVFLIVTLLYCTARVVGKSLSIVTICFIIYGFYGKYFPGFLHHSGFTFRKFTLLTYISTDGIFGTALYSSAWYIVLFIVLGAIMQETGIGEYFTNLAMCAFGKLRGGPAKVAILASGLFGSISGSSIANVVTTGTFTIPMMKKCGFDDDFAGAVEASASTGGQFMPPVMGTTAFLVADMLGIPYIKLAAAAAIPAVLFYFGLYMTVDLYTRKHNIGKADIKIPNPIEELKRAYLFLPLIFLVLALCFTNWTITRAGLYTNIVTIIVVMFSSKTRITWAKLKKICLSAIRGTLPVAIACATVGIITGVVLGSGLGSRISAGLIAIAGGHLFILLLLTMVVSLVLGMGLPTTAAYLMLAVLVAPALTQLGVSQLSAHLFILYFGIISSVTPPVALAAYAAAGISGGNPTKTGLNAFALSISGFVLPFLWVYNEQLLGQAAFISVVWTVITACIGVYCFSSVVQKYFIKWNISIVECVALIACAVLLMVSGIMTDVIGAALLILIAVYHFLKDKKNKQLA